VMLRAPMSSLRKTLSPRGSTGTSMRKGR
jgi:hypothetical protein